MCRQASCGLQDVVLQPLLWFSMHWLSADLEILSQRGDAAGNIYLSHDDQCIGDVVVNQIVLCMYVVVT